MLKLKKRTATKVPTPNIASHLEKRLMIYSFIILLEDTCPTCLQRHKSLRPSSPAPCLPRLSKKAGPSAGLQLLKVMDGSPLLQVIKHLLNADSLWDREPLISSKLPFRISWEIAPKKRKQTATWRSPRKEHMWTCSHDINNQRLPKSFPLPSPLRPFRPLRCPSGHARKHVHLRPGLRAGDLEEFRSIARHGAWNLNPSWSFGKPKLQWFNIPLATLIACPHTSRRRHSKEWANFLAQPLQLLDFPWFTKRAPTTHAHQVRPSAHPRLLLLPAKPLLVSGAPDVLGAGDGDDALYEWPMMAKSAGSEESQTTIKENPKTKESKWPKSA